MTSPITWMRPVRFSSGGVEPQKAAAKEGGISAARERMDHKEEGWVPIGHANRWASGYFLIFVFSAFFRG